MKAAADRFWSKVQKTEGCWLWTAAKIDGYGRFSPVSGQVVCAHRWSYEHHVGPIPEGLTIDHLCRVRNCVNPDHMEPVTLLENLSRIPPRTHCPRGHAYDEVNTYYTAPHPRTGRRTACCRACNRATARAARARRALALAT